MEIEYPPKALAELLVLETHQFEAWADVMALVNALESKGRLLSNEEVDECHAIRSSEFLYALRRSPPTAITPFATEPPVLRVMFAYTVDKSGVERAIILHVGDKATRGNDWCPGARSTAEARLREFTIGAGRSAPPQRNPRNS